MFRNVHLMFRNVHLAYQIVALGGAARQDSSLANAAAYTFVPYTPLPRDFAFTSGNAFYGGCAMLIDNAGRGCLAS